MDAFTPQIALSVNPSAKGLAAKRNTPGDVCDSLFHRFLSRVNSQDDDAVGLFPWLQEMKGSNAGSSSVGLEKSVQRDNLLELLGKGSDRVTVSSDDMPKLAGLLKSLGFSSKEIDTLFQNLTEKDGAVRMDRLLAKLQGMMQNRAEAETSLVVDRSDVPRVEEVLFKMGLGVSQVREVVAKAADGEGNLDLGRLASALSPFFSGVDEKTAKQLADLFRQEMNIDLRPRSLEQMAKDAGLDQALERLSGDAPEGVRQDVKRQITALLQQKGIPAEEVKRFLETLSVRAEKSENPWVSKGIGSAGTAAKGGVLLEDDAAVRISVRRDGDKWQQGGWRERIIDILNRSNSDAGRGNGPARSTEGPIPGPKLAEAIEQAFFGGRDERSGKIGLKGGTGALPGEAPNKRPAGLADQTAQKTGETASKAGSVRQRNNTGDASSPRSTFHAELSSSRADRTAPAGAAAPARASASAIALPEPLPRIVDRMTWMVRAGEQTSRIQISPPELGRLDLEIVIKQGHLHAQLNAENPAVKELIEANLQQLRQQLNNLGFVVERFEVAAGLDDRRFADQQARTGGQRGRRGRSGRSDAPGTVEANSSSTAGSTDGRYQVDVHV